MAVLRSVRPADEDIEVTVTVTTDVDGEDDHAAMAALRRALYAVAGGLAFLAIIIAGATCLLLSQA